MHAKEFLMEDINLNRTAIYQVYGDRNFDFNWPNDKKFPVTREFITKEIKFEYEEK